MAVLKYQNWKITHNGEDADWKVERYFDAAQTKLCAIEYFNASGERHDFYTEPAVTLFFENGKKSHEIWYSRGQMHRLKGPAWISYDELGKVKEQKHYRFGVEQEVVIPK